MENALSAIRTKPRLGLGIVLGVLLGIGLAARLAFADPPPESYFDICVHNKSSHVFCEQQKFAAYRGFIVYFKVFESEWYGQGQSRCYRTTSPVQQIEVFCKGGGQEASFCTRTLDFSPIGNGDRVENQYPAGCHVINSAGQTR